MKQGTPRVVIAAVAILCVCICSLVISEGRLMDSGSSFLRYFIPCLLLLPISTVVGWVPWAMVRKKRGDVPHFAPFFVWTTGALTAALIALYIVAISIHARRDAAARVPPLELQNIVLFDGSMSHRGDGDRLTVSGVSGRVRNEATKDVSYMKIGVQIHDGQGSVIENFEFTDFRPLRRGEARTIKHVEYIHRVPSDMTWDWRVIEARYDY